MFGFRFIKFQPNEYVIKYRKGQIVKEGAGISFYYFAPTTSIVAVPVGSMDSPFMFEENTLDFQSVSVQGQITYHIVDHKKIAGLLNFALDIKGRRTYISDDPTKLQQRIVNIARVFTKKCIENLTLKQAIKSSDVLANQIFNEIKNVDEILSLGIEVMGLSILAVLPNKETAHALGTHAREEILQAADEAIYIRRNASIDQERSVKENEFNTEIAIEDKKRQVQETQIEAQRSIMLKQNTLHEEKLAFETELERKRKDLVKLTVENANAQADAKAYELTAVMNALSGVDKSIIKSLSYIGMEPNKLIATAFSQFAEKADKIGQFNISPDLLSELLKDKQKDE